MYICCVLLVFFVYVSFSSSANDEIHIQINNNTIIGKKFYTIFENKPYVAFFDIPYAVPPLHELRFKPPKEFQSWINIKNEPFYYNETRPHKYYEDCLYLSIYCPHTNKIGFNFPVIIWLHEQSKYHKPDFFIDEDVIVVIISYRTSIFGFLNTDDDFAEGNMGAKDILCALKWLKNNINYFKGDSTRMTVIGSGKAAVLVASLLVTSVAEDLFTRVVIQSGSALSPADYRNCNFDIMNKLYWNLKGPFKKLNRTRLYEILINASVNSLLSASQDIFDGTEVRNNQRLINTFGPTIETSKRAFMNRSPLDVYKRKFTNNNVEVMMGYTSLDSLYKLRGFVMDKKLLKYLNYNFQYLLPFEGKKDEYGSKRYKKIKERIMEFYFVNGTIGERSLRRYAKYVSDQVIYPLLRQARLHAEVSRNNVYLYRFSFKGSLNTAWNSYVRNLDWPGATAGDEICYLFKCKSVNDIYNSSRMSNERHFIKKIARLLANFAKCGNPTPKLNDNILGDLQWTPLLADRTMRALNLSQKLKMISVPERKRMKFWDELKREFFPDKLLSEEL
ncbi:carboxylic ester hydrolase-like [Galleria mellonella]|uniref:Carboxylic ester hydrolase-like n=1 Tax=Galleria mellonella TaxID=7137 RepID=A0A6J3C4D6_GALME|nr:carboxylic ester hydrolase-like [Galleria mellonella]